MAVAPGPGAAGLVPLQHPGALPCDSHPSDGSPLQSKWPGLHVRAQVALHVPPTATQQPFPQTTAEGLSAYEHVPPGPEHLAA
jgi:hypothetical protein